jgi:glucose-1-phosphate adenylyltransferase
MPILPPTRISWVAEPKFDLFNPTWRIGSSNYQGPSPKFFHAELDNSIISAGGLIKGARIRNSIVRREVLHGGGCGTR